MSIMLDSNLRSPVTPVWPVPPVCPVEPLAPACAWRVGYQSGGTQLGLSNHMQARIHKMSIMLDSNLRSPVTPVWPVPPVCPVPPVWPVEPLIPAYA